MDNFQKELLTVCKILGLKIDLNENITVKKKQVLHPVAIIRDLGSKNGMIIVNSLSVIDGYETEIVAQGYGYSVLSHDNSMNAFDIESYKEMFIDWGWTGESELKPKWME